MSTLLQVILTCGFAMTACGIIMVIPDVHERNIAKEARSARIGAWIIFAGMLIGSGSLMFHIGGYKSIEHAVVTIDGVELRDLSAGNTITIELKHREHHYDKISNSNISK